MKRNNWAPVVYMSYYWVKNKDVVKLFKKNKLKFYKKERYSLFKHYRPLIDYSKGIALEM